MSVKQFTFVVLGTELFSNDTLVVGSKTSWIAVTSLSERLSSDFICTAHSSVCPNTLIIEAK